MKELQKKIEKFNEERDWDQFHSPENLAKSICIEAGELLECFQWNNEYDLEEVKEELADVLEILIALGKIEGKTFEEIISVCMKKRIERGGFDRKIFLADVKRKNIKNRNKD